MLRGGVTRNDSSWIAISSIKEESNLIFHDAVRPFITEEIINNCIDGLEKHDAVDVVVDSTDTLVEVDEVGSIVDIPNRENMRRGQTPQAFKWSIIKKAYDLARKDKNFKATDDCGVVLKYLPNIKIHTTSGSPTNIKITEPLDLTIADKIFQLKTRSLNGNLKLDLSKKVMVIFGGSYGIGKDICNIAELAGAKVYSFSRTENNIDIKSAKNVRDSLKEVYRKERKIDVVINTAGILDISPIDEMTDEQIENAVEINYLAPINIARFAKKYLKESKGHLLFFTSSSYTRGRKNYSVYSSSKAAIVNFTQALADEWSDDKIRVNAINPERTATPMREKAFGKEDPRTLLTSRKVADISLKVVGSNLTGQVIDIRREKR